ncbi:hypothetical protein ACHM2U_15440, partial [Clostridium perfringens]|uniref:hypothetical protein n=1 Tax=Clostridium perfringens TaxID=1502 RepID=UPI003754A0D1
MFLKRISKSIAIALVSITIATPLMNTASAMEMNENQDISSLSMDVETVDELNMNEIKVNLDKWDFEEIQLIILDIENNKPSRMKRSTVSLGRQITAVHIVGLGLVT